MNSQRKTVAISEEKMDLFLNQTREKLRNLGSISEDLGNVVLEEPLQAPMFADRPRPHPQGKIEKFFLGVRCDVKWAIGGLFRGWIVLTAVSTFSAALVLANPQNFQFLLKVLGLPETKQLVDPQIQQLLEKGCIDDGGTVVDSTNRGGYRYTILPGGNKCSYPPSGQ